MFITSRGCHPVMLEFIYNELILLAILMRSVFQKTDFQEKFGFNYVSDSKRSFAGHKLVFMTVWVDMY